MQWTSTVRSGRQTKGGLLLLFFFALLTSDGLAREVIPPKPTSYFNDYAGVVSAATARQLNQTLEDFEKSTSSQIVVAIFQKMQSDSSLEDYAHRVFEAWGAGQKDKNNGAVLFIFVQDRRMRIEVGYGLEGALPDALAKRIVDDEIAPFFKKGDYDRGLTAGVTAILQATRGEYQGTGRTVARNSGRGINLLVVLFWLIVVISVLSRVVRAGRGTVYHRRGWGSYGGWWGGGGWGSGGGSSGGGGGGGGFSGGGFSGGGGSSGGGGASGSW